MEQYQNAATATKITTELAVFNVFMWLIRGQMSLTEFGILGSAMSTNLPLCCAVIKINIIDKSLRRCTHTNFRMYHTFY